MLALVMCRMRERAGRPKNPSLVCCRTCTYCVQDMPSTSASKRLDALAEAWLF